MTAQILTYGTIALLASLTISCAIIIWGLDRAEDHREAELKKLKRQRLAQSINNRSLNKKR